MNKDSGEDATESSLKEVIITKIIEGLKIELNYGKAITLNNLVQVYIARMAEHGLVDPRSDKTI